MKLNEIIFTKELKREQVAEGRKKNVKLRVSVGSTGFTNKKELDQENKIGDVLRKKFGFERGIDFLFRKNSIQFTNASDVSPKVMGALKAYVAEDQK